MSRDEHDDHRRGGFGCFPVLLGFFIGVAATLAALILLGLWADQDSPSGVQPPSTAAPTLPSQPTEPAPEINEASPPPSPLLQPDGAPVAEDAPDVTGPAMAPEPEAPAAESRPSPPPPVRVSPPPVRPSPPVRRSEPPPVRAPAPAAKPPAKPPATPRAAQPRDRIEDDAAASGLTSRSRR